MMWAPCFPGCSPMFLVRGGGGWVAATGVSFLRITDNR